MNIELVMTCSACPEQYDAYWNGLLVGYLRLRHGDFTVTFPNVYGEIIYSAEPAGDGSFEDHERDYYLMEAEKAIICKLANKKFIKI